MNRIANQQYHGGMAQQAHLCSLPDELMEHVLDGITRKRDLFSCAVTNRRLYGLALPRLWHTLELDSKAAVKILEGFSAVTKTCPGMEHVRVLRFEPGSPIFEPGSFTKHEIWCFEDFERFVESLQEGQLEDFQWLSAHCAFRYLRPSLWKLQQNIQTIQILDTFDEDELTEIGCDGNLDCDDDSLEDDCDDAQNDVNRNSFPPHATRLILVPTNPKDILQGAEALQQLRIKDLEVHYVQGDWGGSFDWLTNKLFSGLDDTCAPWLGLCSLRLVDTGLSDYEIWVQNLKVDELDHLILEYCAYTHLLMYELTTVASLKLTSLKITYEVPSRDPDSIVESLDGLISAMPKGHLKYLELCLRGVHNRPSAEAINSHSDTLQRLILDAHLEVRDYIWSASDLALLLSGCSRLEQLAISIPEANIDFSNSDLNGALFVIFENTLLKTLNILNWPLGYFECKRDWDSGCRCEYKWNHIVTTERVVGNRLRCLARHVFDYHDENWSAKRSLENRLNRDKTNANLETVALGVREYGAITPRYFVRSEERVMGQVRKSVARVSLEDLIREDMNVDILTHDCRVFDRFDREQVAKKFEVEGNDFLKWADVIW